MPDIKPVIINSETNEAIGPTDINTAGDLTQGNGVRHLACGTTMSYVVVSDTHAVLRCPRCGLRVVFPVSVKTFDRLKQLFC